jgi:uncharacterized OsmC-like protein
MDDSFTISIKKTGPMQFTTTFDKGYPELVFDEDIEAGGEDKYPNPSRVLTASVATCLSASLMMCLNKARIPASVMETKAKYVTKRNEEGYLRISHIDVTIIPRWDLDVTPKKAKQCSKIFKKYCVATNAVTSGVPVNVEVKVND